MGPTLNVSRIEGMVIFGEHIQAKAWIHLGHTKGSVVTLGTHRRRRSILEDL